MITQNVVPREEWLGARANLLDGQVPDDYAKACEAIAHAWRVHAVRVTGSVPGRVWLSALRSLDSIEPILQKSRQMSLKLRRRRRSSVPPC